MALQQQQQEQQTQHPPFPSMSLDGLYCEEESLEQDLTESDNHCLTNKCDVTGKKKEPPLVSFEHNLLFWEDDELLNLISKEKESDFCSSHSISDGFLVLARKDAVDWIFRVKGHYGFTTLTTVLAVNYFDRFVSSLRFQTEKPWMGQLVAVACLSLAAKVEETHVPILLDLQVEECKYVFEAKTIQRMELLVLSTLKWRMNPVTPISYFDHIIRRLGLKTHLHMEYMWRCERLILSIIYDVRFMCYLPSVLATSTMLFVVQEVQICKETEFRNQLMSLLKVNEDDLNACYKLILELTNGSSENYNQSHKRKHLPIPGSPNGVMDASFSSDSSNDSWAVAASVSSSPEPQFKRSRGQDQKMRLAPVNRMYVEVHSSPR